ncbi:MAG: glycoside hydrolase N-terminal domain-containing protein, partial [Armatimonadetes bacterium]|nr:glycoside hydrolase N-terminal domain-containing protein [Armatimonadota bacterium]
MSLLLALCLAAATADRLPSSDLNLRLSAPITTWDEAVPLGNGLLGGLLWGQDGTLRLSLDRGDLWDERPARNVPWERFNYATMVQLAREKKIGELNTIFDNPYNDVYPTKIPAGRLELALAPGATLKSFELNLATAEGFAHLSDGRRARAFFAANQPLALIEVPGDAAKLTLRAPESVKRLGYAEPERGQRDELSWFIQPTVGELRYCVMVGRRKVGATTLLAATVTSSTESADPRAQAASRVRSALDQGYERLAAEHRRWWSGFWQQSRVQVPQEDILRHYYLVQYFHGAASRRGAPPMPLQGVWTADAGGLPPWKGDYHNDLNTQMTYIAYQAAGHFDEGRCFLDFNWDLLPRYRRFA